MSHTSAIVHKSLVDNLPDGIGAEYMAQQHPTMVLVEDYYYPLLDPAKDLEELSDLDLWVFNSGEKMDLPLPISVAAITKYNCRYWSLIKKTDSWVYRGPEHMGWWAVKDINEYEHLYNLVAAMKDKILEALGPRRVDDDMDFIAAGFKKLKPTFEEALEELPESHKLNAERYKLSLQG